MSVAKTVWARLLSLEKGICTWALSLSSPLLEEKGRHGVQKRLAEEVCSVGEGVTRLRAGKGYLDFCVV